MKTLSLVGVLLMVLGILSLSYPFRIKSVTGQGSETPKSGVETENSDKLPPAAGVVLLAGGVVALVLGLRKT